jgi:putative nucleotidyltransferase with HDIG domain
MSDAKPASDAPPGGNGERARGVRRQTPLIRPRPRGRWVHGVVLSLVFAVFGTPLLMAKGWLVVATEIEAGEPAPVTVRVPLFLGRQVEDMELTRGSIVVARGEKVEDEALVESVRAMQPVGVGAWLTYFAGLFLAGLLFTAQLRRSHKGRLLRSQVVALAVIAVTAAVACAALLATPVSALVLPVAALSILATVVIDLGAGLATAILAALVFGALTPFDPGVITVLGVQGAAAALVLGERPRRRVTKLSVLAAGGVGGAAAAASYFLIYYLSHNGAPLAELEAPMRSAWVAAGLAGPLGALVAIPLLPLYQRSLGDISLGTLVELEDLSNPLLKQIAESSPGTWQHSLAMANMAEIAANAIGANGRLVRVGAYYHDLGKSLTPKYFVENLSGGETSPHDAIAPSVSCDAIFSHVTEGVRVARRQGLPERVIDFMHMHHGDGVLEYFWAKCLEQGNPDKLTEEDFRYPGVKPHSKETAILAICDAVEAASRTLRNPDEPSIENLVQRIVYGKLHLGQLDESGVTVADLRKISKSLVETIKHAHHGRIEYPWQKQKRAEEAKAAAERAASGAGPGAGASGSMPTQLERPRAADAGDGGTTDTQRLLREPRLDSLDVPRPPSRERSAPARRLTPKPGTLETAPTEEISADAVVSQPNRVMRGENGADSGGTASSTTAVLTRPPTAAEVARATAPDVRVATADVVDADGGDDGADGDAPVPAADAHEDDFGPFSRPEAGPAAEGSVPAAQPPPAEPAEVTGTEESPQTEWERALLLATDPRRPPPPPPGKRRAQPDAEGPPVRTTQHTVRRAESDTEPVAEVTVQRSLPIPREAVADDGDGPTRPRERIPFDPGE